MPRYTATKRTRILDTFPPSGILLFKVVDDQNKCAMSDTTVIIATSVTRTVAAVVISEHQPTQ